MDSWLLPCGGYNGEEKNPVLYTHRPHRSLLDNEIAGLGMLWQVVGCEPAAAHPALCNQIGGIATGATRQQSLMNLYI